MRDSWLSDSAALITGGHWATTDRKPSVLSLRPVTSASSLQKSVSAPNIHRPSTSHSLAPPRGPPRLHTRVRSDIWKEHEKKRVPTDPTIGTARVPVSKSYSSLGVFVTRPDWHEDWNPMGFSPSLTFSGQGRAPPLRPVPSIPALLPPSASLSYTPPPDPSATESPAKAPPAPPIQEARRSGTRRLPEAFGDGDVIDWLRLQEEMRAAKREARDERMARARAKVSEQAAKTSTSERAKMVEPPDFIKAVHAHEQQRPHRFEEERNPELYVHRGREVMLPSVYAEPHFVSLPPRPYIWPLPPKRTRRKERA